MKVKDTQTHTHMHAVVRTVLHKLLKLYSLQTSCLSRRLTNCAKPQKASIWDWSNQYLFIMNHKVHVKSKVTRNKRKVRTEHSTLFTHWNAGENEHRSKP